MTKKDKSKAGARRKVKGAAKRKGKPTAKKKSRPAAKKKPKPAPRKRKQRAKPKKPKGKPVAKISPDLVAEHVNQLRELFPACVTEDKIDFDRLRTLLGKDLDDGPERYSFTWTGRRDAIRLLQIPSRATLVPCPTESISFGEATHAFVEGDNLEVLKLLYKSYFGKVKMIYIDPPYNTGNDFLYPDNFADPLETYLQLTGQKDSEGNLLISNPQTSGRYHSAWLSMIYPRLFLGRQLLREDGVIFVSIDDNEAHNLRMIMNEIFGEENFVGCICWQKKYSPANDKGDLSDMHDFILVYCKQRPGGKRSEDIVLNRLARTREQDEAYKNPDNDPRGDWKPGDYTCNKSAEERPNLYYAIEHPKTGEEIWPNKTRVWAYSTEEHARHVKEQRIWWGLKQRNKVPAYKRFLSEVPGRIPTTWWPHTEVGHTDEARKETNALFPGIGRSFDTPKPVRLLKRIVEIGALGTEGNTEDLVVLDFFAGSCSTAQAVLETNAERGSTLRFIMVQLPEPMSTPQTLDDGVTLDSIAEMGKERIRRVIGNLRESNKEDSDRQGGGSVRDLGFRVYRLAQSNFKAWPGLKKKDPEVFSSTMDMFTDPLVEGWDLDNVIWEVTVKEGYGLASRVEPVPTVKTNRVFHITDSDSDQALHICLDDTIREATLGALALKKEDLFMCRDAALDDEKAANLALQCRLKTI